MIRTSIAAAAIVVAVLSPASAEPVLKFPNRYACAMVTAGTPFFRCDYTTKTCLRGRAYSGRLGSRFTGEVLAEDRKTVLAHVELDLRDGGLLNYDTGEIRRSDGGLIGRITEDLGFGCDRPLPPGPPL